MRKAAIYILNIMFVFSLVGCGEEMNQTEIEGSETTIESIMPEEVVEDDAEENSIDILQAPSKDEVLAMREKSIKRNVTGRDRQIERKYQSGKPSNGISIFE